MSARGKRHQAKLAGEAFYFTGKPCNKGHVAPRRTHNAECVECYRAAKRFRYEERREEELARAAKYREANREAINRKATDAYWADPESARNRVKVWRSARLAAGLPVAQDYEKRVPYLRDYYQRNKERFSEKGRKYRQEKPTVGRIACANRRARKRNATPPWADMDRINAIYEKQVAFKSVGIDLEVDHIIPLTGRNVCGLHVHWNLRLIPAEMNRKKAARFEQSDALAYF